MRYFVIVLSLLFCGCGANKQGMNVPAPDKAVIRFHALVRNGTLAEVKQAISDVADINAPGHAGQTALMVAIEAGSTEKMQALLDAGADPELTDDFNGTALSYAAGFDFADGVALLLELGVDRGYQPRYPLKKIDYASMPGRSEQSDDVAELMKDFYENPTVSPTINDVQSLAVLQLFLAAGDELNQAPRDIKRLYIGLENPEEPEFTVTREEYLASKSRRYGEHNPDRMDVPFWNDMIRNGANAYAPSAHFDDTNIYDGTRPIWCYDRFGSSITPLPDGRFVQIAGEHEDHYDPDFCIYNDVVVHDGKGSFELYGYPKEVFPPTDFHTATLVGEWVYIIGSLGYYGQRDMRVTPVYRLQVDIWNIEEVETHGAMPNRLHGHRTRYDEARNVFVMDGGHLERALGKRDSEILENERVYELDLATFTWQVVTSGEDTP